MLKWTTRAFAVAAALQFGVASAQDAEVEAGAELIPPGPAAPEADVEVESDARQPEADALEEPRQEAREELRDTRQEAREELSNEEPREDLGSEDLPPSLDEPRDAQDEATERETRFRPDASPEDGGFEISDRVRAATSNLDIDDETRSRYRWHNGEWWFKSRSGSWKFYRDGRWENFDPTTYRAVNSGSIYGGPGYDSGSYVVPQAGYGYSQPQYGATDGYYFESRPNAYRSNVYVPSYGYGGRSYGNRYYNDGSYGNRYYDRGYGYGQGYNPWNDRYYGRGPYGRGYSIDGDRYRGGIIGSEIGGRIGGRTGAIIGGAIGAEASD